MVNHEPDKQLEQDMHRRLRALPDLAAPPQMMAAVMNRLEGSLAPSIAPWWRQPWFTWPRVMQCASFLIFAEVAALAWLTYGNLASNITAAGQTAFDSFPVAGVLWRTSGAFSNAIGNLIGPYKTLIIVAGALLIVGAYFGAIGAATLFNRLATSPRTTH